MGKVTNISWTNATHNFWYGCEKVSPGCRGCYAEREMDRYGKNFQIITRAKGFDKPLSWKEPTMVFINSWSDFFIKEADPWRNEAWDIIRRTPHLTYQILTKRPKRIFGNLPTGWPGSFRNVWLGISAENQEWYDRRWRILSKIRASVRFVSAEPLLGPIRLGTGYVPDWVIVGGETGPGARFTDPEWMRTLKRECGDDVPLFVKQITENGRHVPFDRWPEDLKVRQWPEILI